MPFAATCGAGRSVCGNAGGGAGGGRFGGFAAVAGGGGAVACDGLAADVDGTADVRGGVVLASLGLTLVLGAACDTGGGTGLSDSVWKNRVPPHIASSNITATTAMAGTIKRRLSPSDSCEYAA